MDRDRFGFIEEPGAAPITSEETTPKEPPPEPPTVVPTPESPPETTPVVTPPIYEDESPIPTPVIDEQIKSISSPDVFTRATPQQLAEAGIPPSRGEQGQREYLLMRLIAALPQGKDNPDFKDLIKQGYGSDRAYEILKSPIEINLPATGQVIMPYIDAKKVFNDLSRLPTTIINGKHIYDTKAIGQDTTLTRLYRKYVNPTFEVQPEYIRVIGARPNTGDILVETLDGARGWIKANPEEVERAATIATLKDMGILKNNKLDALGIVAALSAGVTRDQLRTVVADPVDISRAVVYMQEAQKYYESKVEYEHAQQALEELMPFREGNGHNIQRALREGVERKTLIAAGYTPAQIDNAITNSTMTGDFVSVDTYIDYYMNEHGVDPGIGIFKSFGKRILAPQFELEKYDKLLPEAAKEYQDKYGSKAYWQNIGITAPTKLLQIAPSLAGMPYVGSLMMIAVPGGKLALGKMGVKGQELTTSDIAIGVIGATSLTLQGFDALVRAAQAQSTPYNPRANVVEFGGIISPATGIQIPRDYQFTGAYIDQGGGNLIYEIRSPSGVGWILAGDSSKPIQSAFGTQPEAAKIAMQKGIASRVEWSTSYVKSVLSEGLLPISKAPKTALGDIWVGMKPGYIEGNYTPPEIARMARELFNSNYWSNITDKGNYPGYGGGGGIDPIRPVKLATWIIAPNGQIITNVNLSAIPLQTQTLLSDSGFIFVNFASGVEKPTLVVPNGVVSVLNNAGIETANEPIIEIAQVGMARTAIDQALADKGYNDRQIALMTERDKELAIGESQFIQIITRVQSEQKGEYIPVSITPEKLTKDKVTPELIAKAKSPIVSPIPIPIPIPTPRPIPQPLPQPSLTQYPIQQTYQPIYPENIPIPPESLIEPPSEPPPPITIPTIEDGAVVEQWRKDGVPRGTFEWRQGLFWISMPYPYDKKYYHRKPLPGTYKFAVGEDSAYKTIQILNGLPPEDVDADIGIAIARIRAKGKDVEITFKQDVDDAYKGKTIYERVKPIRKARAKPKTERYGDMPLYEVMPKQVSSVSKTKIGKSVANEVGRAVDRDEVPDRYYLGRRLRPVNLEVAL